MSRRDSGCDTHAVTAFVRHEGDLLFVRRGDDHPSAGRWDGVSRVQTGAPADPEAVAREALAQVGIEEPTLVRRGDPVDAAAGSESGDANGADSRRESGDAGDIDTGHESDDAGDTDPRPESDADATAVGNADGRVIHPFLFAAAGRAPAQSIDTAEWFPATEMRQRPTVPGLWRAYRRVAPTIETVAADTDHGSAWISVRALEALRDRAAVADDWSTVAAVARQLRRTHPDMAALRNRVNRAMARAAGVDGAVDDEHRTGVENRTDAEGPRWTADPQRIDDPQRTDDPQPTDGRPQRAPAPERTPSAVVAAAQRTLEEAVRADEQAARRAAALLDGDVTVATLSRSGTVFDALVRAEPAVLIGESRPAGEGSDAAAALAAADVAVTLTTDAALPAARSGDADPPAPDVVLVGADAVLPDGGVVNKVGTRALGIAAAQSGVPLYAVAASDKVALADRRPTDRSDPAPLDPAPGVETWVPTFDRTPPEFVDGIVTEAGVLAPSDVEAVAARHRRHATWDDD